MTTDTAGSSREIDDRSLPYPVVVPEYDPHRHPFAARIRFVIDPELGAVAVRWRPTSPQRANSWIWSCPACDIKTTTADCVHAYSAALALASEMFGITAAASPNAFNPQPERNAP